MDDTYLRILRAAMKGVRMYGLEGIRIQNIAELADLTPGAIYRHFDSKDALLEECFMFIDRQAAALIDQIVVNPQDMIADPMATIKKLWIPYFRFWTARPDETFFYHRFRDSACFPEYSRSRDESHFKYFISLVGEFRKNFPGINHLNADILWLYLLTSTVMFAKNVAEGVLPDSEETEESVFKLLTVGISGYLFSQ